jgi:hypothetical protein
VAAAVAAAYSAVIAGADAGATETDRSTAMTNRRFIPWAAAAAVAATFATGLGIGALADVDAGAAGLPVVQLERVEVNAARPLPPATAEAEQVKAGRAL